MQKFIAMLKTQWHLFRRGVKMPEMPKELYGIFWEDAVQHNRLPAFIMLLMSLAMELLMLLLYLGDKYLLQQASFFPQYIYLYTFMVVISPVLILLLNHLKDCTAKLLALEIVIISVLGVWSAVFSAIDVINGFSSYLFIQIIVINSMIFRLSPITHCVVNLGSFLVYAFVLLYADLGLVTTFAELINPFLMLVVACVIAFFNHSIRLHFFLDQQLLQEQCKKLEFYANNDFLTQIGNRKHIIEHLNRILLRKPQNFACMMIDIDDFKLYNDTYGHLMGDDCLIRLTNLIAGYVTEQNGEIGRYGGEEFLILFEGKSKERILETANKILHMVRQENIGFSANDNHKIVTISMGICFLENSMDWNQQEVLECADRALYKAKKEGKNQAALCDYNDYCKQTGELVYEQCLML